jgi:hypothetical protein
MALSYPGPARLSFSRALLGLSYPDPFLTSPTASEPTNTAADGQRFDVMYRPSPKSARLTSAHLLLVITRNRERRKRELAARFDARAWGS